MSVMDRLTDAPRRGAPAQYTPQQICAILAVAGEPPAERGLPFTLWSQQALADEVVKRGMVTAFPHPL
jgi:hypothetical protein